MCIPFARAQPAASRGRSLSVCVFRRAGGASKGAADRSLSLFRTQRPTTTTSTAHNTGQKGDHQDSVCAGTLVLSYWAPLLGFPRPPTSPRPTHRLSPRARNVGGSSSSTASPFDLLAISRGKQQKEQTDREQQQQQDEQSSRIRRCSSNGAHCGHRARTRRCQRSGHGPPRASEWPGSVWRLAANRVRTYAAIHANVCASKCATVTDCSLAQHPPAPPSMLRLLARRRPYRPTLPWPVPTTPAQPAPCCNLRNGTCTSDTEMRIHQRSSTVV